MLFLRKLTSYGFFKEFAFYLIFFFKVRKDKLNVGSNLMAEKGYFHKVSAEFHLHCSICSKKKKKRLFIYNYITYNNKYLALCILYTL